MQFTCERKKDRHLIDCRFIRDLELCKFVVSIEALEFTARITYDTSKPHPIVQWLAIRLGEIKEWMTEQGHSDPDLHALVCACVNRCERAFTHFTQSAGVTAPAETAGEPMLPDRTVWRAEIGRKKGDKMEILVTPDNDEARTVTVYYQSVVNPADSSVVIYANIKGANGEQAMAKSYFSFKADARLRDVAPWQAVEGIKHGEACKEAGIAPKAAQEAFAKVMPLIWDGVRKGMDAKHQKKSQAKDNKDSTLFDLEDEA